MIHTDGTPIFCTPGDSRNEDAVATQLESLWGCELRRFGKLCPLDWYAIRQERLVGVLELKARTHDVDAFPTVFLNVRKWLALVLAEQGLGVPVVFVVRFACGSIRWCRASMADAGIIRIGGRRGMRSPTDIEPLIEIPVGEMFAL